MTGTGVAGDEEDGSWWSRAGKLLSSGIQRHVRSSLVPGWSICVAGMGPGRWLTGSWGERLTEGMFRR